MQSCQMSEQTSINYAEERLLSPGRLYNLPDICFPTLVFFIVMIILLTAASGIHRQKPIFKLRL